MCRTQFFPDYRVQYGSNQDTRLKDFFIYHLLNEEGGGGGWGLRDEKERVRNLTPSSHEGVVFMGEESRKMCRYISTSRHKTSQAHRRYQLARSRGSGLAGTAMRCLALLVHHYDSVSRNAVITFFSNGSKEWSIVPVPFSGAS